MTSDKADLLGGVSFPTLEEWEHHITYGGALRAACSSPDCPVCGPTVQSATERVNAIIVAMGGSALTSDERAWIHREELGVWEVRDSRERVGRHDSFESARRACLNDMGRLLTIYDPSGRIAALYRNGQPEDVS